MGEDVEVTHSLDEKEGFVKHLDCPWYHWHKKQDLLEEAHIEFLGDRDLVRFDGTDGSGEGGGDAPILPTSSIRASPAFS